jgi:hypothetical protein
LPQRGQVIEIMMGCWKTSKSDSIGFLGDKISFYDVDRKGPLLVYVFDKYTHYQTLTLAIISPVLEHWGC